MAYIKRWVFLLLLLLPGPSFAGAQVWHLEIQGPIGSATMEYLVSSIEVAHNSDEATRPDLIILQMDTPGGLDNAMRQIIQRILSSEIPIVGYVYPQGARAASAGTYLLYATHFSAMAPATTLGAATPVQIGMPQPPASRDNRQGETVPQSAMERKIVNDATAFIEGLADLRERNREWAAEAVKTGAALASEEALKLKVINLVAQDISDLLLQLDGMTGSVSGNQVTLNTKDAVVTKIEATWRHKFLAVISNPSLAYMLMLIGVYGLIFEFYNPGGGVLGVAGTMCILTAFYGFQLLPINYAGLALILLGIAIMILDALFLGVGVFGALGVVSLIIGSIILIDTPEPAFQIAWQVIAAVAVACVAFTFLIFVMLVKNRGRKIVSGVESIVGETIAIESIQNQHPMARIQGELWQVKGKTDLKPGDLVTVKSVDGLILNVYKHSE